MSQAACSLKSSPGGGTGLQVKLRDSDHSFSYALGALDLSAPSSILSIPLSGLGANIGCFVVGALGGAVGTGGTCSTGSLGSQFPGLYSTQSTSVSDTFTLSMPVSDGVSLAAFGGFTNSSGTCDATPGNGGGVAYLGNATSVTTDVTVEIPVSFSDPNNVLGCTTSPYQVFSDTLKGYSFGASVNSANTGGKLSGTTGTTGANPLSAGATGVALLTSGGQSASGATATFGATKPYLSAKATFNTTSVAGGAALHYLAFTDNLASGSGNLVYCGVNAAVAFTGVGSETVSYGGVSSYSGVMGINSLGTAPISGSYTIQCDMEPLNSSNVKLFIHVTSNGVTTNFSTTAPVTFNSTKLYALFGSSQGGGGLALAATVTDFSVSTADTTQE
ncbi:MAG: hypothetical protein HY075_13130 [Deltaproteobacteria bacterium]|nr:hypothetical protein [Deltaproteobacteria bacterium]